MSEDELLSQEQLRYTTAERALQTWIESEEAGRSKLAEIRKQYGLDNKNEAVADIILDIIRMSVSNWDIIQIGKAIEFICDFDASIVGGIEVFFKNKNMVVRRAVVERVLVLLPEANNFPDLFDRILMRVIKFSTDDTIRYGWKNQQEKTQYAEQKLKDFLQQK